MDKNTFLIYNDLLFELYNCTTYEDLASEFLPKLRFLVPFSYASFLQFSRDELTKELTPHSPIAFPAYFAEAEQLYCQNVDLDLILWPVQRNESILIKESDLLDDEKRIGSDLYRICYSKYNVYDSLQYDIVRNNKPLAALSIFRTKFDGSFTPDDTFLIHSLGGHLETVLYRILAPKHGVSGANHAISSIEKKYSLTSREVELLTLLSGYANNNEISQVLSISENTVQKHLQNLFRKLGVSSKWELLRFLDAIE